ncbi:hypothetical protein ACFL2I_07595 [Candidatus Omnitrophota bacterium]
MKNIPKEKNNAPGADLNSFELTVRISGTLLGQLNTRQIFLSPYSLIAPMAQILGLNTPAMGSGNSPYSITSFIFDWQDQAELLRQAFNIPLSEKRKIIDEFYEMIAPVLLSQEQEYIELLVNTKYKRALSGSAKQTRRIKQILRKKFSIFSALINRYSYKKGDYGYIVHYGYPEDLYREHDFLQKLPRARAQQWRAGSFPIVNEMVFNNFPGSGLKSKTKVQGWVIFIANYTKELLEDSSLRKNKILQAARLAEKLGAKIVGMGGLVASFAQGGQWLSRQLKDVGFSTGHAYTIGNILEMIDNTVEKVGLEINEATIAVLGAAGSIGSGCVKLLAPRKPKSVILIDLNSFNAQQNLELLNRTIKQKSPDTRVKFSAKLSDMRTADIVIVATNSPTSLIAAEHLKPGAILIDDSFPKNASQELLSQRDDIILLEGGIMQLPKGLDIFFARNMPDLMDAPLTRVISCKQTYGCFAEILVLALFGHRGNYGLGYSDPELAEKIISRSREAGFSLAPAQCFDRAVEEKRFRRISRIVKQRQR